MFTLKILSEVGIKNLNLNKYSALTEKQDLWRALKGIRRHTYSKHSDILIQQLKQRALKDHMNGLGQTIFNEQQLANA